MERLGERLLRPGNMQHLIFSLARRLSMFKSESRKAPLPAKFPLLLAMGLAAFGLGPNAFTQENAKYTTHVLNLPAHGQDNITNDYITYDEKTNAVWAPAINIGSVYVIDAGNEKIHEIKGFATKEISSPNGRKGAEGPSGVYVGDGVVYIGDRADQSICAVDEKTLERKNCGHIDSTPDGVAYVAPTNEVWVTAPRDKSVRILDSRTLTQKEKLTF